MIKLAHKDNESILFQFDAEEELGETLKKICAVRHQHFSFTYLPPGRNPSDPHPQHGYVGMRWDEKK